MADQLDLPKDQGIVIAGVSDDSPAAKAGLKANDVLLELAGKPVPADVGALIKQVREIKADDEVSAVVLRKGRKETVKGLSLPEAKKQPALPGLRLPNLPGGRGVSISSSRNGVG